MKLLARVNRGTWIADCPNCGGAEIAKMNQPFMCAGYVNGGFHGETNKCGFTAEIEFPPEKLKIEALLIKRPVGNRNWEVGETLEQLKKENEQRGIRQ